MPNIDQKTQKQRAWDNKYIPWYFVAFFVGLAILDAIFVTTALSTHRGVVTEHSYEKGLKYNETIANYEKQEKLGWQSDITYKNNILSFTLIDGNNKPISNAKVTAYLSRIVQNDQDFSTQLQPVDNKYQANINLPLKGIWDIKIAVEANGEQYQQSKRIIIK